MRKKNGFVISTTLYSIFGIMLLTVFYILYALSNNRYVATSSINDIKNKLGNNTNESIQLGADIVISNLKPINDSEIKSSENVFSYPINITHDGSAHLNHITIKLTNIIIDNALKDIDFRWGLYNTISGLGVSFGTFKNTTNEIIILTDTLLDNGETKNYDLKIWLHDDGTDQENLKNKLFSCNINVSIKHKVYTDERCFTFSNGIITDYDFAMCGTNIVIPRTINGETVTTIGGFGARPVDDNMTSFYEVSSVIIPNSVTEIADGAFYGPPDNNIINNITIPESVTTIGAMAFEYGHFDNITIPENVTAIGDRAFTINNIETLIIPGSIKTISDAMFDNFGSNIILMEGIEELMGSGGYGFFQYSNITEIEIPRTVTKVSGDYVFDFVDSLEQIVIRGKSSLEEFSDYSGFTYDGFPEGINIVFRP